jgi:hypothetical protein
MLSNSKSNSLSNPHMSQFSAILVQFTLKVL